jgi:hypothetical protein
MSEDLKAIIKGNELAIQTMMLDLNEKLGVFSVCVDQVEIDTRNFANLKTTIHTKEVAK